ncbi:MAG: hypothetical protein Q6362_007775 [Candidatus Wukongarchaeota archaeon]|nr:hypothetical protein [Candidatus Wukongarchaeota archaeon]
MSEIKNERGVISLVGKTIRIPFDALVEELGLERAIRFISKVKKNYGNSVIELREKTRDLTMEEIEKRIKMWKEQGR